VSKAALIVHGGAGNIPREAPQTRREGLERALDRGWRILHAGGSALDACEQAIIELENSPLFDAGTGAYLNRDGRVQLDAILMDGATLKSGAVAAVERLQNPVCAARIILEHSPHMLIVGGGAEQFATEHGLDLCDPKSLITERALEFWSARLGLRDFGTVGAAAVDASGNLAAGTSTGGTAHKYPGRVGDSPLVGCGCYADNLAGAVSTTGEGESIMRIVMAKAASDFVMNGQPPQAAADAAIALLTRRTTGRGGLIIVDGEGRVGAAFSTPHMAYGFRISSGQPTIHV
jgi:beta-aspartyl-peptidase (threonine type)